MHLRNGQALTLTTNARPRPGATRSRSRWSGLPQAVKRDDVIYLADGSIRLRVREAAAIAGADARSRPAGRWRRTRA